MNEGMYLAKNLKYLRKKIGLNQSEIADIFHVTVLGKGRKRTRHKNDYTYGKLLQYYAGSTGKAGTIQKR